MPATLLHPVDNEVLRLCHLAAAQHPSLQWNRATSCLEAINGERTGGYVTN